MCTMKRSWVTIIGQHCAEFYTSQTAFWKSISRKVCGTWVFYSQHHWEWTMKFQETNQKMWANSLQELSDPRTEQDHWLKLDSFSGCLHQEHLCVQHQRSCTIAALYSKAFHRTFYSFVYEFLSLPYRNWVAECNSVLTGFRSMSKYSYTQKLLIQIDLLPKLTWDTAQAHRPSRFF